MGFTSAALPGEEVISDSNWQLHHAPPPGLAKGRIARDWGKHPYGSFADKFDIPIIGRDKWPSMIAMRESTKSNISDLLLQAGIPSLNQQQTNYCWCNAVTGCVQTTRAIMGLPYAPLSPASVAAPVTGYRNEGGYGLEALQYIIANGVCSTDLWPANAIDKQYMTDAAKANAALHKVTEWYELPSRGFDALATCLLLGFPVAIGLNWWSHEVMACDLISLGNGAFGVRFRNSWGDSYGSQGFNTLTESKATPDDACSARVVLPSNDHLKSVHRQFGLAV